MEERSSDGIQCVLCVYASVCLSSVVVGGDEGHLADGGGHRFLPDLHLDGCTVLSERSVHVTHGDVLLQAGGGASAGHLA